MQPQKRGQRTCESDSTVDTKINTERGPGGAPGARDEILLHSMVKTMVRKAVPLQPMEVHTAANMNLPCVEDPMLEEVDVQRRL